MGAHLFRLYQYRIHYARILDNIISNDLNTFGKKMQSKRGFQIEAI